MTIVELLVLSAGLSMDACAVAICKGACMREPDWKQNAVIGLSFGFFQGLMPLLGWMLGTRLHHMIQQYDHWIAFILLFFLGAKMIWDALNEEEELVCKPLDIRELLVMSVATSIDALAAGIALAVLQADILPSVLTIGGITAGLSFFGVSLGVRFGQRYQRKAQLIGGTVLILIGARILLDHLNIF